MKLILPRRKLLLGAAVSICAPAIIRAQVPMTGAGLGAPGPTGGPYVAQGVNFNGSTNLHSSSGLTATNGKQGIVSFWINNQVPNGFFGLLMEDTVITASGFPQLLVMSDSTFRVAAANSAMLIRTLATFASGTWHHIISSWDVSVPTLQIYVDGVSNIDSVNSTSSNTTITYNATAFDMGSRTTSGNWLTADIADFYMDTVFHDLSNPKFLAKFISGGNAVNLGPNGATPTGTSPVLFLSGAVSSWQTNKGTGGGGLTVSAGALSASTTNPP